MKIVYQDISLNGKDLYNKNAVLNYLDNLLSIRVGEVPFNRAFGTYLENYLFEPYSFLVAKKIELEIERAIARWLPMVTVENISVDFNPDSQEYDINLSIKIDKIQEIIDYNKTLKMKAK